MVKFVKNEFEMDFGWAPLGESPNYFPNFNLMNDLKF